MEVDWTTCDDRPNDKGWSAYFAMFADVDMEGVKDGESEVPFWCRQEFWDLYEERFLKEEHDIDDIEYKRTQDQAELNHGRFRIGRKE